MLWPPAAKKAAAAAAAAAAEAAAAAGHLQETEAASYPCFFTFIRYIFCIHK